MLCYGPTLPTGPTRLDHVTTNQWYVEVDLEKTSCPACSLANGRVLEDFKSFVGDFRNHHDISIPDPPPLGVPQRGSDCLKQYGPKRQGKGSNASTNDQYAPKTWLPLPNVAPKGVKASKLIIQAL